MTTAAMGEVVELLAIGVGGLEFALDLASVKEVIRPQATTPVAGLPAYVAGVINFRGVALPVIDLKARFQAADEVIPPEGPIPAQRLVICAVRTPASPPAEENRPGIADKVVAFQVDGASEIVRVPRGSVLPAGDVALRSVIHGIVAMGTRTLVWLDTAGLLASDEPLPFDRFRRRVEEGSATR